MNKYLLFLSNKGRKQIPVDFEYNYDDIIFSRKIIKAVDDYCRDNDIVLDKSAKYKYILKDENDIHLIAEYNANTFNLYVHVFEIAYHNKETYEVICNHRYQNNTLYFWIDKRGLNVNLLSPEWDNVLEVELAEIRRKLSNTKILPCNKSKLKGVEEFNVYQVDKEKTCSIYKTILIKSKAYRTIDELWDEFD